MQQSQGNAAVRRMLGQVVQRDDDDNQTNVSDAGVAYTSVQDSDASDTNVISVSTSSGDESSSDGGVIAGALSADVSDAGENDQNVNSSATGFGTGPALSFFDNTPMGVLKPRTKKFHSSSEEDYTLNKIHDQSTVSAGEDAVNYARSQVGSVIDNQPGEVDPDTQKPTRYGWRNLDKYYISAYGGKDGKYDESLQHNVKFFNGQHLSQSWCGIFAVWALKEAGASIGNWRTGLGIYGMSGVTPLSQNTKAKTGDIGIKQPRKAKGILDHHHFILTNVQDGKFSAIDGNNDGKITESTGRHALTDTNELESVYRANGID